MSEIERKNILKIIDDRCEADKNKIYKYKDELILGLTPEDIETINQDTLTRLILIETKRQKLFLLSNEEESEADAIEKGSRKRIENFAETIAEQIAREIKIKVKVLEQIYGV